MRVSPAKVVIRLVTTRTRIDNRPVADEAGVGDVETNLDEAERQLRTAVDNVSKLGEKEPWRGRSDDLALLAEQIVDLRQQILLLKLEVPPGPAEQVKPAPAP